MDINEFLIKFEQKRLETGTVFIGNFNGQAIRCREAAGTWQPSCPIEFMTGRRGAYHWGPRFLNMTEEDISRIICAADSGSYQGQYDLGLRDRLLKAAGLPTS